MHLDKNFNVLDTPADHEGHENEDAPDVVTMAESDARLG